jgi:hypothetical protein
MSNQTSSQVKDANADLANASEKEKEKEEQKESILDKVKRNVEKLKETKKNAGGSFLKIQSGEVKTLQFTGDMEPVQRTFKRKKENGEEEENKKIMYAYKVLDMQRQDEGIKVWEVSKSWSDNIDNLLVKGFLTLEVKRTGAGTDTSYLLAPIVSANNSGSSE